MYIDYSKLWKLLIDKELSKTDLLELTGMSSRVLAKLSKNETVTTDTIARICTALNCDVSDIMECVSDENLSVYGHFKKYGKCVEKNDRYSTVQFSVGEQKYTVYVSNQTANKRSLISCNSNGNITWDQLTFIWTLKPDRYGLIRPDWNKNETVIVLIKGKPGIIKGLDTNGFVSSRGERKSYKDVYVMSEAAFKLFEPKSE